MIEDDIKNENENDIKDINKKDINNDDIFIEEINTNQKNNELEIINKKINTTNENNFDDFNNNSIDNNNTTNHNNFKNENKFIIPPTLKKNIFCKYNIIISRNSTNYIRFYSKYFNCNTRRRNNVLGFRWYSFNSRRILFVFIL